MKSIQELWQKHPGKSAVLFGNGPSLLEFAKPYYQEKLDPEIRNACWMSINYAFEKLPGKIEAVDFVHLHDYQVFEKVAPIVPPEKLIFPIDPGLVGLDGRQRVQVYHDGAYGYPIQNPFRNRIPDLPFKRYDIALDVPFFTYTTTMQSALHIACYMGFSNIYLVGVDYQMHRNGKIHYESEIDGKYAQMKSNPLMRHKEGDDYLIPELIRQHGVKICNLGKEILKA